MYTDDPSLTAYRKSKAVAEQAAWRSVHERGAGHRLTTVLPGAVFGPLLHHSHRGSAQIVERLLGGMPGTARIGFEVVDVRDLADLHIRAMTAPEAAGERFIGAGEFLWMSELAAVLRDRLGDAAAKVPTRTLPDTAVRLLARVTPGLRALTPYLGRKHLHVSDKAERVLGWRTGPAADPLADCARSLVERPVPRV